MRTSRIQPASRLLGATILVAVSGALATTQASILPAPLTLLNNGSDVITPSLVDKLTFSYHPPSNPTESQVAGWVGLPSVTELYKMDADPAQESGSFASSYSTTFNPTTDPVDALLEYVSGATFASANLFALLKDGNHDPTVYVFNISNWNRTADLSFEDFWPDKGAISHLSIYGATGGTTGGNPPGVPEPLSVLVWMALCVSFGFGAKRTR